MAVPLQKIPSGEQRWLSESFVDPNGRLFEWRGDLYRSLDPAYAERWERLVGDGTIEKLMSEGLLVESELTKLATASRNPVLRHRRVAVVSYCHEWVPEMLRDAALITLDLCLRLAEKGLTLQDGHPWNVLFDGTRPVYVDAGSIVPEHPAVIWASYQQFCNFFIFPLYLYAAGLDRIARWLLRDYLSGVSDSDLLAALPMSFKLRHPSRYLGVVLPRLLAGLLDSLPDELRRSFLSIAGDVTAIPENSRLRTKFFESLRHRVASLSLAKGRSSWARYYSAADEAYFNSKMAPGEWRRKREIIAGLLDKLRPASVLDVGANTGAYSRVAAAAGARVTACENDIPALAHCHEQAREQGLNILPLANDIFYSSHAGGRGNGASSLERLRSELVMGLAVIHHVTALHRLSMSAIVERFASVTTRWLLLEYVSPLLRTDSPGFVRSLDDYTADDVESCLRQKFSSVSKMPSFPTERLLFLCEK